MAQYAQDKHHTVPDPERTRAAKETIEKAFYVDNLLTSCSSVSGAVGLAVDVNRILSAGHFQLRKWNSNSAQVISLLTNDVSPSSFSTELVIKCPTATVLGLRWDPAANELFFLVELEATGPPPAKRRVLSEVAQLFDPTGLLAPIVIIGKMFIQTLWSAGIPWDAPLQHELRDTWTAFRNGLPALNRVRIPRWLGMHSQGLTTLHGFCDASSRAYAAVIYTKTTDVDNKVHTSLLTARTKVAPLKRATIPRLELSAAHLLAVTFNSVRGALGL